jgi:hypothetical protein
MPFRVRKAEANRLSSVEKAWIIFGWELNDGVDLRVSLSSSTLVVSLLQALSVVILPLSSLFILYCV